MTDLTINGKTVSMDLDPETPILWALRDTLEMTGTKFGCGAALCGACTVHMNGQAIRSCVTPISAAAGQKKRLRVRLRSAAACSTRRSRWAIWRRTTSDR